MPYGERSFLGVTIYLCILAMLFRTFFTLITTLLLSLTAPSIQAQGVDTWHTHASFHNTTRAIPAGEYIAALSNGSLMLYHPESDAVTTFSRTEGLNGVAIVQLGYSAKARSLVLVYADAGIDLLRLDTHVVQYLGQVKQSTWMNKTIRGLNVQTDTAYIALGSGLVVVDVSHAAILHSYAMGEVRAAQPYGSYLFAATSEGVKRGLRTANLADPSHWESINPQLLTHLGIAGGRLWGVGEAGIYNIETDGNISHSYADVGTFAYFNDTAVFYGNAQRVMSYNVATHRVDYLNADAPTYDLFPLTASRYVVAAGFEGLHIYGKRVGNRITERLHRITPNSPIRPIAYHTTYDPYRHRIVIAGGQLSYTGADYPGTAMYFDLNYRTWHNLSETMATHTGVRYANTTAIAPLPTHIKPTTAYTYAVSTAGNGVYLFNDTTFVSHYDNTNAPLMSILPQHPTPRVFVRTDGMRYDAAGNLWLVNNQVDTSLHALTPSGQWHSFYIPEIARHPTLEKMHIDPQGRLWILSRRYTDQYDGGVLMHIPSQLATPDDDRTIFRSNFVNQDGVTAAVTGVYAIAQEADGGAIWIGTNQGPYRIDQPESFADASFTYTQVKIPRNDGTNHADYLLANVPITAIAIDGGGRKWFGTDNDGLYVISANGQEVLHHFTMANSPLPTNTIASIAIVPTTGEVFVGTMLGVVSYESGVIAPADNLSSDDLHIFPNPITPLHANTRLTIQGLTHDAEVKITNAAGHLVHLGRASGGTYQWDTRNAQGQLVPSGVYYLLIATSTAHQSVTKPITIVR